MMGWVRIIFLLGSSLLAAEALKIKYDYTDSELTAFINQTVIDNFNRLKEFIFSL